MHDELVEGQILAGKYRVERVLGKGGMGVVVAARHLQLDERVAIKFMLPEGLANPEAVARFAREARAAVKIKSEHVARVSDVGALENGAPYMVMEHLDGGDLSDWLARHGVLAVEQAVEFVLQAGEAIAEAHSLGIVHRDLKPANLFVIRRPDGALSVKVLDFGISKVTSIAGSGADFGMTKTTAVLGSPLYMSPEQMRSTRDVDARSDIWALGVILYELLAGVPPFLADAFPELILKIATSPPEPLRSRAPAVPPRLEAVILKCLAKDPAQRFGTVGQFAVALAEFAPRRSRISVERISGVLKESGLPEATQVLPPASGPISAVKSGPISAVNVATGAAWGQTQPRASSGKRALLTFALLSVAALGFAGYAFRGTIARTLGTAEAASAAAGSAPMAPTPTTLATPEPIALPRVSAEPAPSTAPVEPAPSAASQVPSQPAHAPKSPAKRLAPAHAPAAPAAPAAPPPAAAPSKPPAAHVNNVFDDR
jgi:serine/threonine-protein kinase